MICHNRFYRCLVFLTLLILPINIRIVSRSSIFVQDMIGFEPTTLTTNSSDSENEGMVSGTFDFPGLGSLLALTGPSLLETFDGDAPTTAEDVQDVDYNSPSIQGNGLEQEQREQEESTSDLVTKEKQQPGETSTNKVEAQSPSSSTEAPAESAQKAEQQEQPQENKLQQLTPIASKDDPNTFAACLQIMDDNHFLIEWLAYHYHVMPLRRLIVLVDPNSRSSPQPILDRWKDRMDITVWNDTHVYPKGSGLQGSSQLFQHRQRQKQFVRRCLQKLHKQNRGWVFLTDTDEYAMINDRVRDPKDSLSPVKYLGRELPIPSQEEPGSVMQFLEMKETIYPDTNQSLWNNPCLTMARKIFGTKEGKEQPPFMGYNPRDFQTLLWQKSGRSTKPGKSIVNLKYFKYKQIENKPSIHRPGSNEVCRGKFFLPEKLSVIVANHYPGTLEQMLFRQDDARGADAKFRNATKYRIERFKDYKKLSKHQEKDTIRQWLPGFIASVGEAEAKRLLEFAGRPAEASYLDAAALAAPPAGLERAARNSASQLEENAALIPNKEDPLEVERDDITEEVLREDPNSFASCLMVTVDHPTLMEWIAYHYHVMPLRRLILLTDSKSRASPQDFVERWQDKMDISVWEKEDFDLSKIKGDEATQRKKLQRIFIERCLKTLIKEEREWAFLTAVNEFAMINDRVRNPNSELSPFSRPGEHPPLPTASAPGTVLHLLKRDDVKIPHTKEDAKDSPCITMSRKTFSGKQGPVSAVSQLYAADFQTMKWRYYDDEGKAGRSMLNLKRIQARDIPSSPSPNRPVNDVCKGILRLQERDSIVVVNRYTAGIDLPKDLHANILEKETIKSWLPGFISSVGEDKARELLRLGSKTDTAD